MPIVIPAEAILYLTLLITNTIGKGLKSLEGKSVDEIKAMIAEEQSVKTQQMAEMHSTDPDQH